MTNDPFYIRFLETSWRRKLTAAEEAELAAWLETHPECKADWDAEAALNQQLGRLQEPDLSNNFTARVLQQIDRPEKQPGRARSRWTLWILRLLPPAAAAALVLLTFHHQQVEAEQRKKLLESVVMVSDVKSLPSAEILKNFDAIRELNSAPGPDEKLISLLQ
jgi:anti-sigma factor RsiW